MSSSAIVLGMGVTLILAMASQLLALKVRVPGIVVLLPVGFVAGHFIPDVNLRPALGEAYAPAVSLAVAMILFDGGLELNIREMRAHVRGTVRRLQTLGVAMTATAGTLLAWGLLDVDWRSALMFGVMIVVSGPTVIGPLLNFARPGRNPSLILSWEGTTVDAIGAILAAVVYAGFVHPDATGILGDLFAFAVSIALGLAGAAIAVVVLWLLLTRLKLSGLMATQVIVMTVVGVAGVCDAIRDDTGLIAAISIGLAFANLKGLEMPKDRQFFATIVQLVIGVLFISISSSVSFSSVSAVLVPTLGIIAVLVLVVRPLIIGLLTLGSALSWQERVFIGWMHPRGIIAAATAASFGVGLTSVGIAGADKLLPAVFLVILGTVAIYGLTASRLARRLGLQVSKDAQTEVTDAMPAGPAALPDQT